MYEPKVYLAGSIRDGSAEDIAWRERAIAALQFLPCTILSPLAGKDYDPTTKKWTLYGKHLPDAKYIVHADYWCVDRMDIGLFDFRSLAQGYPSIGTVSEWGRSTARSTLRLATVDKNQKGANAVFGLHPFLEQHAAKVFNDIDEMIEFAADNIKGGDSRAQFQSMIRPIILSRTDTFIAPLFDSMERHNRGALGQTVVADNGLSPEVRAVYFQPAYVAVPNPFCFSKAVNLAVATTRPADHLMILNDDTEAVTEHWLYRLEKLIEQCPEYGIISCSISGGAFNKQNIKSAEGEATTNIIEEPEVTLAFIAVVISRSCWDMVGPMDERFVGYGYEDNDYCLRARQSGFKTGITRAVIFKHGRDGQQHSSSFLKYNGTRKWNELRTTNQILFNEKWGIQ